MRRFFAYSSLLVCVVCCSSTDVPQSGVTVVTATEVGILPRSPMIRGRDGAPSAVAFGKSVFTYGDTILQGPDARGENWHTNSFGILRGPSWSDGFDEPADSVGAPKYFIERTPDEVAWDDAHAAEKCAAPPCHIRWAIWPSAPLVDPGTGNAWVLYGLFNEAQASGIGVAIWKGLDKPVERLKVGDSWLLFPKGEPEYANAPTVFEGFLYAFACSGDIYSEPCTLARVPIGSVATRADWRFFDGSGWSTELRSAVAVLEGGPIMSVTWVRAISQWLIVYTPPLGDTVMARTARKLEGPWSEATPLFQVKGQPYDANVHAELAEKDGMVQYVTYSRDNGGGLFAGEHVVEKVELQRR